MADCVICTEDHPRCAGHAHVRDENGDKTGRTRPCMRPPRRGATVCDSHGGTLPVVRKAAARRVAQQAMEADAEAFLISTGDEGVPDVPAAMARLAAMTISMVEGAARRVAALQKLHSTSDFGVDQAKVELQLLQRSIDQAGRLLELTAKYAPSGENEAAVNLLTSLSDAIKGEA